MIEERSHAQLALVSLLGLLAAVFTAIFPVQPPLEDRLPNALIIRVHTMRAGEAQVFWNRYAGFSDAAYPTAWISDGNEDATISFPLPAGRIVGLLLKLPGGEAPLEIRQAKIAAEDGRVIRTFAASEFTSKQKGIIVRSEGETIELAGASDAGPTMLEFKLGGALVLPDDSPKARALARPVIERQRWLGLALGGCTLYIGWIAWRRSQHLPSSSEPLQWFESVVRGSVALVMLFSRRPDVFANPQFWAEDGAIFFVEEKRFGWRTLFQPYAGYLHTVPRMVAGAAGIAPAMWAPALYTIGMAAVVVWTVMKAASRRVDLPLAYWSGLAVVLVPNMDELVLNITNAQWFGAIIMLLIAVGRSPANAIQAIADVSAIALFGLTGPFAVFFAPLFLARFFGKRTRYNAALVAINSALAVVQLLVYLSQNSAEPAAPFDLLTALAVVGHRTVGQLLNLMPPFDWRYSIVWGLMALTLWLAVWVLLPMEARLRRLRPMLGFAATIVLAGGLWGYRVALEELFQVTHTQRYFYLPLLVTLWVLIGGLTLPGWHRALFGLALATIAIRNVEYFRITPLVDHRWYQRASAIDRGEPAEIPINPLPWTVTLGATVHPTPAGESQSKR